MQQLLAELVTVTTMSEQTKVVMDCEIQVAQGTHELGFDEGNHIQYHTPSCKRIECYALLVNLGTNKVVPNMGVIHQGVQHSVRPKVLKIVAMKITVWLSVHPSICQTTLHHKK